jgi:hypothetical protein
VAAYFRPKSHQLGAHMFGFEQSTGDIIIFLDADDLLEPEVMLEVAKVWRPGVSKVHYRMNGIDATGAQLGTAIPQFPPKDDPKKLRRKYLRTMAYTTPPGSGNAYSRDFVRNAFAFGPTIPESDAVLLTIAPILGDVLTIRKPLARYRIHATNTMAMSSLDTAKLRYQLEQDVERVRWFAIVAQQLGFSVLHDPLRNNPTHLQCRLASYLVEPSAHPFSKDTKSSLVCHLMSSLIRSSQMPLRDRAILLAWTIVCALAPPRYRQNLILWRFVGKSRPPVIRTLLGTLSSLRSPHLPDRTQTKSLRIERSQSRIKMG